MHELIQQVVFYGFALVALICALMVVLQSNPVRAVLFLVAVFFASAVLWLLMQAEFLALILVLVYVGAVMTLFLFVVMMLNIDVESERSHRIRYLPFGLIFVTLLVALLMKAMIPHTFDAVRGVHSTPSTEITNMQSVYVPTSDTEALGLVLYTDNVLALEMAAFILLVAIIATITLVHRPPVGSKQQKVVRQIMTRREDRVKLVQMPSEPFGE